MSTRNVKEHLADHLAIRDLLERYTNGVNQRDWAAVEAVFTADATWEVGGNDIPAMNQSFSSAPAIAAGISSLVNPMSVLVQSNHAAVIEVNGNTATAVSTINEFGLPPGADNTMTLWGTYYDDIVRDRDGEWRFKRRKFRLSWLDMTGPKGQVIAKTP